MMLPPKYRIAASRPRSPLRLCVFAVTSLVTVLLSGSTTQAQQRLTLQDAIARTLQHNFDISIADLASRQAARNNTLGNAGFSPNVALNTSVTESMNNVHSELASGGEQNNPRAINTNFNPYLTVNWTIFDGGRMFLVKKQLNELEALSVVQLKAQTQAMVSRTIQMYARMVWQHKQLQAISTALLLAKVRMQITDLKFQTGAGAKIDYLQARVDYNARLSDSLTYITDLTQAADSLSVLMGENEDNIYVVDDSLQLDTTLQRMDKEKLAGSNLNLAAYRYNAEVSRLNARIANRAFLPTLAFNGGYAYNRSTNSTGFALFTRSYGPVGTFSLNMPLFAGGNIRRQANVASLQAMRDDLLYDRQNTVLDRQYRTAWNRYSIAVAAYNLENESIIFARENVEVQQARFRLGVGTTLESRQAENDYVTALQRLHTAAYNLKINETIVLELENLLVK